MTLEPGQPIRLAVPGDNKFHLFDKETGKRVSD
jgi:hypothetical protein